MAGAMTYSVLDAARVLGIGTRSVYDAIRDGRLPALRIGRKPKLRIPKAAIEVLLRDPSRWESGTTQGGASE
jgi:excisionase family DNA binding protein